MDETKEQEFKAGFPPYFYTGGNWTPLVYRIKLRDGQVVDAYVDTSTQYRDEGLNWINARTRAFIYKHNVLGWQEIPPETPAESAEEK